MNNFFLLLSIEPGRLELSIICIIPARGGSKRIPRKNIKDFCGKPIIAYSIEAALESGLFSRVIVSTDDEEISMVAKKLGAEVPFLRSLKNSDDHSSTVDVLLEVVERVEEDYPTICCIYPTAPFLTKSTLQDAYKNFQGGNFDSLVPVAKYSYPPQRGLIVKENKLQMLLPENKSKRSQDLEPIFHDVGQFYFLKTNLLTEEGSLFTNNTGPYQLNESQTQDIDNPDDWLIAEFKYQYLLRKGL